MAVQNRTVYHNTQAISSLGNLALAEMKATLEIARKQVNAVKNGLVMDIKCRNQIDEILDDLERRIHEQETKLENFRKTLVEAAGQYDQLEQQCGDAVKNSQYRGILAQALKDSGFRSKGGLGMIGKQGFIQTMQSAFFGNSGTKTLGGMLAPLGTAGVPLALLGTGGLSGASKAMASSGGSTKKKTGFLDGLAKGVIDFGSGIVDGGKKLISQTGKVVKDSTDYVVDLWNKGAEKMMDNKTVQGIFSSPILKGGVEVVKDMTGLALDVGSITVSLYECNYGDVATDLWSIINGTFDTGQDLAAPFAYYLGKAFGQEELGEEMMNDLFNRNGLAGELRADERLDGLGDLTEGVDGAVDGYKAYTGTVKFAESLQKAAKGDFSKLQQDIFGYKSTDMDESDPILLNLKLSKDNYSNVQKAFQFGSLIGSDKSILEKGVEYATTIVGPGKRLKDFVERGEDLTELYTEVKDVLDEKSERIKRIRSKAYRSAQ